MERVSEPTLNVKKTREILMHILSEGKKTDTGEKVLCALMYFMDFNFYEKHEEHLMGMTYKKERCRPVPSEFRGIVDSMKKDMSVKVSKQKKYTALREPDLTIFNLIETNFIYEALGPLIVLGVKGIDDLVRGDLPLLVSENKQIIEYECVFYRVPERIPH